VATPIHLSTTFERSKQADYPLGYIYSREDNPNRHALEECLASLEGGSAAISFSSGLAAVTAVIQGLEPGAHIVAPDDAYYGIRRVIGDLFAKWGLETSYVDMTNMDDFHAALRPNTRLVWVETPSNPLMKVTDLPMIAALTRMAGSQILTVCDSTFATPVLQQPLECGIDMVMHSTTKYLGGHCDVMGGALITHGANPLFEHARKSQCYGGGVPSPFDCWLTLRGIETLPWRVRAQSENALRIAQFLEAQPAVEKVHYPGLPSHSGHKIAARQMSAFGGMLSFQVRGSSETALGVAARCELFTRATSLGGTHSLIEHRASVEGPETRTPQNLLRVSVGLEHIDDLIADLERALSASTA
jgi:cystathionine gamma-synthase